MMNRIKLLHMCMTFVLLWAEDNSDVAETHFFIPFDEVVIQCPRTVPNSTIIWMHDNIIYWTGEKFNFNIKVHKRLDIVGDHENGEFNLRIVNTSIYDEGFYICLHNSPPKAFKYLLKVNQKTSKQNEGSTLYSEIGSKPTIKSTLFSEENTQDLGHISRDIESGGWMIYSLLSVSVFSAILIGLLCLLFYKHRNSFYKHNDLHNIASESARMNDTPPVYHIIDENRMEAFIPDVHQHIEISSVGTQDSDPIEDDRSQREEPEYLHPYHSLISVIDAERHDYEQTAAQVDDAILLHETYFQRKKSIDTQINQLEWNKMFNKGDCTTEDLRIKAKDNTFSRTTFSDNEIGQSEPNVEPISVNNNITIVKPYLNLVCDNISLD